MSGLDEAAPTGPRTAMDAEDQLHLTDAAADRIKASILREGIPGYGVRVGVVGGGCSGFQYQLTFEERPKPDDVVWVVSGVRVFVDPSSKQQLGGVTLDFVTGLHSAGFKFINPKAGRTCGCGSSFGV